MEEECKRHEVKDTAPFKANEEQMQVRRLYSRTKEIMAIMVSLNSYRDLFKLDFRKKLILKYEHLKM
jgi:hypothetical protein